MNIQQGTNVQVKLSFQVNRRGRPIVGKEGSQWWVTSTTLVMERDKTVTLTRIGKPMGTGITLTLDDFHKYFEISL